MPRKNRMKLTDSPEVEEADAIDTAEEGVTDGQESEQTPTESTTSTSLPEQATGPASAPESTPEAAGATPASAPPVPRRRGPIDFAARAKPCPPPLSQMNDVQKDKYHNHPPGYAEAMTQLVPCQAIERIAGRIGLRFTFDFPRGEVIFLPRWFALTYPDTLVIKE